MNDISIRKNVDTDIVNAIVTLKKVGRNVKTPPLKTAITYMTRQRGEYSTNLNYNDKSRPTGKQVKHAEDLLKYYFEKVPNTIAGDMSFNPLNPHYAVENLLNREYNIRPKKEPFPKASMTGGTRKARKTRKASRKGTRRV